MLRSLAIGQATISHFEHVWICTLALPYWHKAYMMERPVFRLAVTILPRPFALSADVFALSQFPSAARQTGRKQPI
jgi:hypothetical protein